MTPLRAGVLRRGKSEDYSGVGVTVAGRTLSLNPSARAIWELCDGTRSLDDIAQHLGLMFKADPRQLALDVEWSIAQMLRCGLLRYPHDHTPTQLRVEVEDIRFYVINCRDDKQRRRFMAGQLDGLGLKYEFIPGVRCDPAHVGKTLAHLKVLQLPDLKVPFAVLEDDCQFDWCLPDRVVLPWGTDALFLGVSRCGTELPGSPGRSTGGRTWYNPLDNSYLRVFNMLGAHGVVYLSQDYHRSAVDALLSALTADDFCYPPDVALAALQATHRVVAPRKPLCYQAGALGGREGETSRSLCTVDGGMDVCSSINDMEIVTVDGDAFFLFLDVFVHWDGARVCAVCPCYGEDIDWADYGVDFENITLDFGEGEITGRYIPYRLDSWEPSVLLDFESEDLARCITRVAVLEVVIRAGRHVKRFCLATDPPQRFDCAMSIIIRDENRWIGYYLDYYLHCMGVDHVYVYDNNTRDQESLKRVLAPYIERSLVTLLPWHYRWRNRRDRKQIGQPPQQTHTLNRFGGCKWIGFFDVDEFLRIPGRSIPEFLSRYDPDAVGGVSFGLRWFMYKGEDDFDQVGNPLLSFFHSRRDPLGRKRQKLFVSPSNVRFMRFHWIQEDQEELAVDDGDIFFHHYYLRPGRFEAGLSEADVEYDDYMSRFSDVLEPLDKAAKEIAENELPAKPDTVQAWIDHVNRCLVRAERFESGLEGDVLNIRGMCGTFNRHFYNNLCRFAQCRYLEIGSWRGASLCSAMYDNGIYAVSIDDWSDFTGPKSAFEQNVARFKGASRVTHLAEDCFSTDASRLGPFNVYLYDGPHREPDHFRALERYLETLEDISVVVVDDWNYGSVRKGTRRAIAELDIPVVYEREIIVESRNPGDGRDPHDKDGWWNGILIMVIDKNPRARDH